MLKRDSVPRRNNGTPVARPRQSLVCGVLMLLPMLGDATAQAPGPVDPAFVPILAQLKRTHQREPVLLPAFIARQRQYGPLTPDMGADRLSYTITLSNAKSRQEGRDYPDRVYWVCMVHGQALQTKNTPYSGKRVILAGGIPGWFKPARPDLGGPFATLGWRYKTGQYSLGLTHATQAELIAMANSEIQHPVQLR